MHVRKLVLALAFTGLVTGQVNAQDETLTPADAAARIEQLEMQKRIKQLEKEVRTLGGTPEQLSDRIPPAIPFPPVAPVAAPMLPTADAPAPPPQAPRHTVASVAGIGIAGDVRIADLVLTDGSTVTVSPGTTLPSGERVAEISNSGVVIDQAGRRTRLQLGISQ